MDSAYFQKIKEVFAEALEKQAKEREDFLREKCADDAELLAEVKSLLDANDKTEKFIEQNALDIQSEFVAGKHYDGTQFGNYKIIGEIGRGGMGAVFLAERSDGEFQQQVALKVVRQTILGSEAEKRFRRERQILASLNHPHIARLLDGGVSEWGEPFLVMEFIAGEPLLAFAEKRNLQIEERLRLFLKVCAAVAYAHRNLVVHRDLKPSNILVMDDGTPKLLDFGLATILDLESDLTITATEFRALTPAYASPEQLRGAKVTTASDIYSLGVCLYELLTGSRPHKSNRYEEILRLVSHIEPPRLSEIESDGNEKPKTINGRLKGDLDNIALTALRKEPERRYRSVEQFAEDIERHLRGLPVAARPATFRYRAGKFVKRNYLLVTASGLMILSLLVGTAVAVWQAREARGQARLANQAQTLAVRESEHARREADKSQKISRFMSKVLSYANPAWYAEGNRTAGEAKIMEVVEDLAGKIDVEFANQPDIQAELHHQIGDVYRARVGQSQAEPIKRQMLAHKCLFHTARALELRRRAFGEKHEEVAKDLYYLGAAQLTLGDERGWETHQRAVEMMRETNPNNANLPYLLEDLAANTGLNDNNWAQAERLLNEALTLFRQQYGDGHYNVARVYADLSRASRMQGNHVQAAHYQREAEERMNKLTNPAEIKGMQEVFDLLESQR